MDLGHAAGRGMTCGLLGFLALLVLALLTATAIVAPRVFPQKERTLPDSAATVCCEFEPPDEGAETPSAIALDPGAVSHDDVMVDPGSPDDDSAPVDAVSSADDTFPPVKGWTPGMLFVLIPARVRKERLLEHWLRRRIVDEVRRQPGIHHRELLRLLSVSNGTLAYHLRLLERAGLLRFSRAHGRKLLWVPEGEVDLEHLLMTERERQLVGLLTGIPSARLAELGPRCGLKSSTVGYHVDRLRARGLVEAHREGHALVLSLAAADGGTPKVCTTNDAAA